MSERNLPNARSGSEAPSAPLPGSVASSAYQAMMNKKLRNDRRKAIAFDLLKAGEHVSRHKAAEALAIARRLV